MTIEFIMYWLLVGVIGDVLLISFLTAKWNRRSEEHRRDFRARTGYEGNLKIEYTTILEQWIDTPWWAHVLMIAFPPSILSQLLMEFEVEEVES